MDSLPSYRNPVWPGYCADPFVWRHAGCWYAVGTGGPESADAASRIAAPASLGDRVFPLLRSRDLTRWEHLGGALDRPDVRFGSEFWAPAVAHADGSFHLFYSVGPDHQLRVAHSARPEGPYCDHGPLLDPGVFPFAIDPHPFEDVDGTWWLFYARDFPDLDGGHRPGTALAVDRLIDMRRLAGEERVVLRARHDWQRFQSDRTMYGAVWDWHTLEGACVLRRLDRYWCLYSGACYGNESYGMDWAVADAVTGPWSAPGAERGPRLLRTVPGAVRGPGHATVTTDDAGQDWLVYHAWNAEGTVRQMCIDRLDWTADGPICRGPTWTPQAAPTARA
ncbi:MAG: family 43 glycosylhydrolase [Planctomycetes bacterium]|nr:family 43 glycosylhydrolase [Planctomycetota bacterium]